MEKNYRKEGETTLVKRLRFPNETMLNPPVFGKRPVDKDASTLPLSSEKSILASLNALYGRR